MFPAHGCLLTVSLVLSKVPRCFREKQRRVFGFFYDVLLEGKGSREQDGRFDSRRSSGWLCGAAVPGTRQHSRNTHTVTQIQALASICCHVLNNLPVPALNTLFLGSGCSQHGHDGHPGTRPAWAAQRSNAGGRGWGGGGGEGACVSWERGEGAGRGGGGGGGGGGRKGGAAVPRSSTSGSFGSDPNQPTPLLVPSSCLPPISFTAGSATEALQACVCRMSVFIVWERHCLFVFELCTFSKPLYLQGSSRLDVYFTFKHKGDGEVSCVHIHVCVWVCVCVCGWKTSGISLDPLAEGKTANIFPWLEVSIVTSPNESPGLQSPVSSIVTGLHL